MLKNKALFFLGVLMLNVSVLAKDKNFYLKAITALNKNCDMKTVDSDINFALKQQANFSPALGVGIGYHINSFVRVDLIFERTSINFPTKSAPFRFAEDSISHFGLRSVKRKANIQSVMFNGYIDIIDNPTFNMFLGSGIGIGSSRIKETVYNVYDSNIRVDDTIITLPTIYFSTTNKNKNTFSYSFIAGTNLNINENFSVELAYAWKYAGKVRAEDKVNNKYQGHNVSAALRFDL